jgi:uncharacterized protein (TIGR03067 family)
MKRLLPSALAVFILAAAEGADQSKSDLERMQGDWAAETMVRDGQTFPDEDAQAYFRTVKGDTYTIFRFNKVAGKGTMKIDATKTPKTIDFTPDGGKIPGLAGIYSLEGDVLKLCTGLPGKERPTKFESKEGTGFSFSIWRREKR